MLSKAKFIPVGLERQFVFLNFLNRVSIYNSLRIPLHI